LRRLKVPKLGAEQTFSTDISRYYSTNRWCIQSEKNWTQDSLTLWYTKLGIYYQKGFYLFWLIDIMLYDWIILFHLAFMHLFGQLFCLNQNKLLQLLDLYLIFLINNVNIKYQIFLSVKYMLSLIVNVVNIYFGI